MGKIAVAIPVLPEKQNIRNYIVALEAQGMCPHIVEAGEDLSPFDGLLMPGGVDIAPARYGQPDLHSEGVCEELDALQFAVLEAFVRAGRPILGICRGHQLVNVYFGGTLFQHLARADLHTQNRGADNVHDTVAEANNPLFDLYGERFPVNSSHHQGVDRMGKGLRAIQWSADGVLEGMIHESLPILCVQWHPERMCQDHRRQDTVDGDLLFRWFRRECENA